MKLIWLFLVLIVGLLVPTQVAMNSKMKEFVLNPMYGTLVNFGTGAVALIIIAVITVAMGQPSYWRGALDAPWWAWMGGFVGAAFVTVTILAIPHTGALGFSVAVIAGQLAGALILDHFGWFGLMQRPASFNRLAGAALLFLGMWLIQRD